MDGVSTQASLVHDMHAQRDAGDMADQLSSIDHRQMDHSKMDQGQMMEPSQIDHSQMDHSSPGNLGMGHGMMMYFHGGYAETILFSFWQIDSVAGLLGSMLGIFLLTMLYEGLKVYREYLLQRALTKGTIIRSQTASRGSRDVPRLGAPREGNGTAPLAGNPEDGEFNGACHPSTSEIVVVKNVLRPHPLSLPHLLQTGLHVVQLVISYFLMLIFMTYNVWLCVAVALGAGAGYFAFGWRKKTVIDVNECCQ